VGQAWPLLLLYPGGLSAILFALLLGGTRARRLPSPAELLLALGPLLLISVLPLPRARDFPFAIDLITALFLLELPRWQYTGQQVGAHFLRPYLPLLIGAALLFQASDSLTLAGRGSIALAGRPVYVAGALIWSLALPAIWREHNSPAMALRTAGHLLLALVLWSKLWL
jgi:hypothetical protein